MVEGITIIKGSKPGPIMGIGAFIHGDEPAGVAAHAFLKEHFATHELPAGELWLIEGNIEAHAQNSRCVARDMNRMFVPDGHPALAGIDPSCYDYRRCRELMPILAQLDYLLDLHNTTRASPPFSLTMASDEPHKRIASNLPVELFAYGFEGTTAGTTTEWVHSNGGVGITVECGYQGDPNTGDVAIACCKSFLGTLGIPEFANDRVHCSKQVRVTTHEMIADKDTFDYAQNWTNFDVVPAGAVVATDSTRKYIAPEDDKQIIIFPVSIKTVREGSNTSAYFLATIESE